jgi:hypothetical protein
VVRLDDHYRRAKRAGVGEAELTRLLLQRYMIRRELKEVEPDLPEKIRERVEIPLGTKGKEYFDQYLHHMARADEIFFQAALEGTSREKAKNEALGAWAEARHALVDAKVADGAVADVVEETVEAAGCCLVFGHHVSAMRTLMDQLTAKRLTVAKAFDVPAARRVEAEKLFQSKEADVYIGGLGTAVGISLNRADACIHIEQDYVPGVMTQAEARAQGVGQKAENGYLIRTCFNAFGLPVLDDMDAIIAGILAKKLSGLNELHNENESLDTTIVTAAGDFNTTMAVRSWAKAQERLKAQGT